MANSELGGLRKEKANEISRFVESHLEGELGNSYMMMVGVAVTKDPNSKKMHEEYAYTSFKKLKETKRINSAGEELNKERIYSGFADKEA